MVMSAFSLVKRERGWPWTRFDRTSFDQRSKPAPSEAITIPCDRWARRNPENYESNRPVTSHSPKRRMPTLS